MSPGSPLYAVHTTGWGLAWRPALPPWLLAIGFILAVALVVHLYRAQRALAPVWTIRWLTLLRLALVALLIVLLADPVLRWVQVVDSPGQLWLVLDGSQSMAFKDPQAGAVERLRWACALGLIPKDLFSDAWDRDAARLLLLREQLRRYRTLSRRLASSLTRRGPSPALLRDLRVWLRRLRADTGRLGAAAPLAPARSALAELAVTTVSAINGWQNGQPPPFSSLLAALNLALRRLAAAARDRDQLFLAAHGAQGNVRLALNRVAGMSRSDLAVALLTGRGPAARRAGALAALVRRKRVRLVRFAGKGVVLPPVPRAGLSDRISDALRPAGNATNIAAAITAVARHVSPRRAATVLLVSDGRQNVGPDPSPLARWLAERGVRTYAICLGSNRSPPTLSIQALQAPHWIFQAQRVKAVALVHLRQLKGKTITVQFWRGGKLLHTHVLTATRGDQLQRVTFTNRPPGAGIYHYALRIRQVPSPAKYKTRPAPTASVASKTRRRARLKDPKEAPPAAALEGSILQSTRATDRAWVYGLCQYQCGISRQSVPLFLESRASCERGALTPSGVRMGTNPVRSCNASIGVAPGRLSLTGSSDCRGVWRHWPGIWLGPASTTRAAP